MDPKAAEHSKRACELVASQRYGRYLVRGPGGRLAINVEAVRAAARMGGKYVLLTNDDTLTPEDVSLGYKPMMIIEACFRRMKTTVVSHVKLRALALLIERAAELRTGDTWRNLPPGSGRDQGRPLPRAGDDHCSEHTAHGPGRCHPEKAQDFAAFTPAPGR